MANVEVLPKKRARRRPGIQLKIEVLMRGFDKAERTAILQECGFQESTWWGWCRYPSRIPGGAMKAIVVALRIKHGKPFDFEDLMSPVA